jgi:hypothetical protein
MHTESGWLTVQRFTFNRRPEIKPAEPALDNASEGNKIDTDESLSFRIFPRKDQTFPPVSVRSFLQ